MGGALRGGVQPDAGTMRDIETMIGRLEHAASVLQVLMLEERQIMGKIDSCTPLATVIHVISSVCQSLLLQSLQKRFPHSLNAQIVDGSQALEESAATLTAIAEHITRTVHSDEKKLNSVRAFTGSMARDWAESCDEFFFAVRQGKNGKSGNGQQRQNQRPVAISPEARLTTVHGTPDQPNEQILATTKALSGLGHVANRTEWSGESPAGLTAWVWRPGDKPCHSNQTLLPLAHFLPPENAAVVALHAVAQKTEEDIVEWRDVCDHMGISPQLSALREEGWTPHVLRDRSQRQNGHTPVSPYVLICNDRERALLGSTTLAENSPDALQHIPELRKRGIPVPDRPTVMTLPVHQAALANTGPMNGDKSTEDPSLRRDRVKAALNRLGRKSHYSWKDAMIILDKAGVDSSETKTGGGHYTFTATDPTAPQPWRTSEGETVKDHSIMFDTLKDILVRVGNIDALEKYARTVRPDKELVQG